MNLKLIWQQQKLRLCAFDQYETGQGRVYWDTLPVHISMGIPTYTIFIVVLLQNATIEYSSESVCVHMCVCFCVCVFAL